MDLSIVSPVYNELESVEPLCKALHDVLPGMGVHYEIILVNDGSTDGTREKLQELVTQFPCLKVVNFRRNYGQTAAMSAGFHYAEGEVVITLDADLQNDPKDIPMLYAEMTEDVDVVSGWRKDRKDKMATRKIPSMLANRLISKITGVSLHDYGCTLKAYRKDVIKNITLYGEMHRFIPALASWVGRGVKEVVVTHHARQFGESKYGLSRTFRVVLDLITVKFLLRYSMGPIQLFGKFAGIFIGIGLLMFAFMIGANASFHLFGTEFASDLIKRPFWNTTAFMLLLFGVQFISMGLLAEIQIRTYYEGQNKRTYVVREVIESSD